nr:MAG TPA: ATP-dependent DNA helicase [Bacteriophage sp.]
MTTTNTVQPHKTENTNKTNVLDAVKNIKAETVKGTELLKATTLANNAEKVKADKKAASQRSKKLAAKNATKKETARVNVFDICIPSVKNTGKLGEYEVTSKTSKKLAVPTKVQNDAVLKFKNDVQWYALEAMRTELSVKINNAEKTRAEHPEKFTEARELTLNRDKDLLKCVVVQQNNIKSHNKSDMLAMLAAAVLRNKTLCINVQPLLTNVNDVWSGLQDAIELAFNGKPFTLTKDQQTAVTELKADIVTAMSVYLGEVKSGKTLVAEAFPLKLGNKDVFKLLCGLYSPYALQADGYMKDGLRLDSKDNKTLQLIVQNLVFDKMVGVKSTVKA